MNLQRAQVETALSRAQAAESACKAAVEALTAALAARVANDPPEAAPAAPVAVSGLTNTAAFYDVLRASNVLGPVLTESEVQGCNAIIAACAGQMPLSWTAYALATAYHETAGTMQPIREYGRGKGRKYGAEDPPGSGRIYYGRGYVQLTWRFNYAKAEAELGQPFVAEPDLALRHDLAAAIMVRGMKEGWFTGKSLNSFIPAKAERRHYVAARRIINGTDKADLIADHALTFERALKAGDWR